MFKSQEQSYAIETLPPPYTFRFQHWIIGVLLTAFLSLVSTDARAADLEPTPVKTWQTPPIGGALQGAVTLNNKIYFAYDSQAYGCELWVSDGSETGTSLFINLWPGVMQYWQGGGNTYPICPQHLIRIGDHFYFYFADGSRYGWWKSDGTVAGTKLYSDGTPGGITPIKKFTQSDIFVYGVTEDGKLYFNQDCTIWRTDGTEQGTIPLKDLCQINGGSKRDAVSIGNVLFFVARDDFGEELWMTDGTPEATVRVTDIYPGGFSSDVRDLVASKNRLFFIARDQDLHAGLWKVNKDGTGLVKLKEMTVPTGSNPWDCCSVSATKDDSIYIQDALSGQYWVSEGTVTGTVPSSIQAYIVAASQGKPVLFAPDKQNLWKTDGTEANTAILTDTQFSQLHVIGWINGVLVFQEYEGIWRSDGSLTGTYKFQDNTSAWFAQLNDLLYFNLGSKLWKSDTTSTGTIEIASLPTSHSDPLLDDFGDYKTLAAGESFNFVPSIGLTSSGDEIWHSTGISESTQLVAQIYPAAPGYSRPGRIHRLWDAIGDQMYFDAFQFADGIPPFQNSRIQTVDMLQDVPVEQPNKYSLWKSDGTANGTMKVIEVSDGFLGYQGTVGNTLFFSVGQTQLWRSDGSTTGTTQLKNLLLPGESIYEQDEIFPLGMSSKYLYLYLHGRLWRSDGSTEGTLPLVQFSTTDVTFPKGSPSIATAQMLYFAFYDEQAGIELWKSDGSVTGTLRVKDIHSGDASSIAPQDGIVSIKAVVYFFADDGTHGKELWRSDGSEAGTILLKDINPGVGGSNPGSPMKIDNILYFVADDGIHGKELWRSDGTEAGTYMVKDIFPGRNLGNIHPRYLTVVANMLFFNANNGIDGEELWVSDGTADGTRMIEIYPGGASSNPQALTQVGNRLFFTANSDAALDRKLWMLDIESSLTNKVYMPVIFGHAISDVSKVQPGVE